MAAVAASGDTPPVNVDELEPCDAWSRVLGTIDLLGNIWPRLDHDSKQALWRAHADIAVAVAQISRLRLDLTHIRSRERPFNMNRALRWPLRRWLPRPTVRSLTAGTSGIQALPSNMCVLHVAAPRLEHFRACRRDWVDNAFLWDHLRRLTRLTHLSLVDCGGVGNQGLKALHSLTGLTHLVLIGARVNGAGLAPLSRLTALQHADLSECAGITDAGLKHLSGLSGLVSLSLADCHRVSGQGVVALRPLAGTLHSLDLIGCNITARGVLATGFCTERCEVMADSTTEEDTDYDEPWDQYGNLLVDENWSEDDEGLYGLGTDEALYHLMEGGEIALVMYDGWGPEDVYPGILDSD